MIEVCILNNKAPYQSLSHGSHGTLKDRNIFEISKMLNKVSAVTWMRPGCGPWDFKNYRYRSSFGALGFSSWC